MTRDLNRALTAGFIAWAAFATPRPYFLDCRYGKRRTWGALGYGLASVVGGVVHDAGNGGYGGVMIVFVTSTLVALATTLPIGTTTEAAGCQESTGQRCVCWRCLTSSVRILELRQLIRGRFVL